jgi:hypothetical protein
MTYCVGWKYRDAVFLLADTAVTKNVQPSTSHSSFGQLHAEVRGEHVEEGLLKLVPLNSGTVAAFAGDVELATSCLEFIYGQMDAGTSLRDVCNALTISLGPFPEERPVDILIAFTDQEGRCELVHWNSSLGLDPTESDWYQIGSLTSYHADLTPALLSLFVSGSLDTERMLPVASAIVQSYGIHHDLLSMNVGGLVFGAQSRLGSVTWQPDTNYFIYSLDFSFRGIITAIARDNTLVVSSSITDDTRVFGHIISMPRQDLWTQDWVERSKREIDSGLSPLWVFISTAGRVITIIFRSDVNKDSRYVKFQNLGGGKFDIGLSPDLMALLQQPLYDRNDGSLPFRLNVRNE